LDETIRPLFDHFVRRTTIVDGADLLDKLQAYVTNGYFTASTWFITFDVTDLYTMLPQEESLVVLTEFLREYGCEKVNGLAIDTIVQLARIVLEENVFVYDQHFYRQIIGGAMGSAFTLTLANIFMWKWEKHAILAQLPKNELYGRSVHTPSTRSSRLPGFVCLFHRRYIDDVFITSNDCEARIEEILSHANAFHPNIHITWEIAKQISFLDLLICNNNGSLSSAVYHKPAAEPAVLPFSSDHPRHVFQNIVQTALMRAIRYSSTLALFNDERRRIRLMLVYNG
jgi:hypothetical protein